MFTHYYVTILWWRTRFLCLQYCTKSLKNMKTFPWLHLTELHLSYSIDTHEIGIMIQWKKSSILISLMVSSVTSLDVCKFQFPTHYHLRVYDRNFEHVWLQLQPNSKFLYTIKTAFLSAKSMTFRTCYMNWYFSVFHCYLHPGMKTVLTQHITDKMFVHSSYINMFIVLIQFFDKVKLSTI